MSLVIEILYFEGCPTHAQARERVEQVLRDERQKAQISVIAIISMEDARAQRFIGSPTIRINGRDVEKKARDSRDFGYGCRIYMDEGRPRGLPSVQTIREALIEALAEGSTV